MTDPLEQFQRNGTNGTEIKQIPVEFTKKRFWIEFGITFAAGGIIVSCVPLLLRKVDPTIASIVYGFPLTFIPIIVMLYLSDQYSSDGIQNFSVQSALSFILTLVFVGVFAILLGLRTKRNGPLFTFGPSIGITCGVWVFLAGLLYIWIKYREHGSVTSDSLSPVAGVDNQVKVFCN